MLDWNIDSNNRAGEFQMSTKMHLLSLEMINELPRKAFPKPKIDIRRTQVKRGSV